MNAKDKLEMIIKEYEHVGAGFVPVYILKDMLECIKSLESALDTERVSRNI